MRAWRHAGAYDARRGRVATWLLSITRNLAIDHLRAKRTEPLDPDSIRDAESAMWATSAHSIGADTGTRELRDSLGALPADQRRALLLAALFGFTAREIGADRGDPGGDREDADQDRDPEAGRRGALERRGHVGGPGRGGREMTPADCEHLREIAAEVALGIADGEDRAWALDHLDGCPACRARIERLSTLADELLLLAPADEPPPGSTAAWARRSRPRRPATARACAAPGAAGRRGGRRRRLRRGRGLVRALRRPRPRGLVPGDARGRKRRVLRRGADGARRRQADRLRLRLPGPLLVGAGPRLRRRPRRRLRARSGDRLRQATAAARDVGSPTATAAPAGRPRSPTTGSRRCGCWTSGSRGGRLGHPRTSRLGHPGGVGPPPHRVARTPMSAVLVVVIVVAVAVVIALVLAMARRQARSARSSRSGSRARRRAPRPGGLERRQGTRARARRRAPPPSGRGARRQGRGARRRRQRARREGLGARPAGANRGQGGGLPRRASCRARREARTPVRARA